MSQQNVEVVRRAFEAWNAGDMDQLREIYHPEIILRAPPGWPEPGPFVGRDAVLEANRQLREAFERDSVIPLGEFRTAGDRVIVRVDWRGIGRGPQSDMEVSMVFTVRDEFIFGLEYFWDHGEALETAGLSE